MIDFWGVDFEVAERMNLNPRLREVGYIIDHLRFVDERNCTRSQLGGDVLRRVIGDRFISLPRGDLAKAIFGTIVENVEVIFGDSVTAIREDFAGVEVSPPGGSISSRAATDSIRLCGNLSPVRKISSKNI